MNYELSGQQWHDVRFALRLIIRNKKSAAKSDLISNAINAIKDKYGNPDLEMQEMFYHYYVDGWGIVKISMSMYYDESTIRKHLKIATRQFVAEYDGGHLLKMFAE